MSSGYNYYIHYVGITYYSYYVHYLLPLLQFVIAATRPPQQPPAQPRLPVEITKGNLEHCSSTYNYTTHTLA